MSAGSRGRYEGVPSCLRVEIFSSKGDRYLMKERAGWEVFGGKICRFTGARSSCFVFSASCFWFWFSGIYYKHARCDFDPLGGLYPALESACYVGRASYFYVVGGGGEVCMPGKTSCADRLLEMFRAQRSEVFYRAEPISRNERLRQRAIKQDSKNTKGMFV